MELSRGPIDTTAVHTFTCTLVRTQNLIRETRFDMRASALRPFEDRRGVPRRPRNYRSAVYNGNRAAVQKSLKQTIKSWFIGKQVPGIFLFAMMSCASRCAWSFFVSFALVLLYLVSSLNNVYLVHNKNECVCECVCVCFFFFF